jgi:hypothetical protein
VAHPVNHQQELVVFHLVLPAMLMQQLMADHVVNSAMFDGTADG